MAFAFLFNRDYIAVVKKTFRFWKGMMKILVVDDYLAKPFAIAELMARIRSLLRRRGEQGDAVLVIRDITLDTKTREVRQKDRRVELTPKEFSILEFLLYNKNRAVSRFTLAEHVWGDEFDPFTMSNFIDVHIKNMRYKLGDADAKTIIRTIRGIGFIIEETPQTPPATICPLTPKNTGSKYMINACRLSTRAGCAAMPICRFTTRARATRSEPSSPKNRSIWIRMPKMK